MVATISSKSLTYAATAGVADSLQLLTDGIPFPSDIVSAGGYVAIPDGNWRTSLNGSWTVAVYPVSGGAPVIIPGQGPLFEPGVSQPHLMLQQYPPSTIFVSATDGTAAITQTVPDFIAFARWLGSTVVYGSAPDASDLVTISALSSAGTVSSPLASEVSAYAWAPSSTPRRLFYSRSRATAGGPFGVFYVELPRGRLQAGFRPSRKRSRGSSPGRSWGMRSA